MTWVNRGALCAFALIFLTAPLLNVQPASAAFVCGNRAVNVTYVVPQNCAKACINKGHSAVVCRLRLVRLCQKCWGQIDSCSQALRGQPPLVKCQRCSERYARCMRPFLG